MLLVSSGLSGSLLCGGGSCALLRYILRVCVCASFWCSSECVVEGGGEEGVARATCTRAHVPLPFSLGHVALMCPVFAMY